MNDPIPKTMLEAELQLKIGQMKVFMKKIADVDDKAREEILSAIEHLYHARKILNIDNVH